MMRWSSHSPRVLAGALAVLAAWDPAGAQDTSGIFELRCRGGQDLFVVDAPVTTGSDSVYLHFQWHLRAAGATGSGLQPGTCGWLDREARDFEPSTVHVRPAGAPTAMLTALSDSTRFWSFWVFNTNQGHFQAVQNGVTGAQDIAVVQRPDDRLPVTPSEPAGPEAGAVATRPESDANVVVSIHNVRVHPELYGVGITFEALPGLRDATVSIMQRVAVRRGGSGDAGEEDRTIARLVARQGAMQGPKVASYSVSHSGLASGQAYTFAITVPRTGAGDAHTESGSFTTLRRQVSVRFTSIRILDDSDELSDGEGSFTLALNPGDDSYTEVGGVLSRTDWSSGRAYALQEQLTIDGAPDQLRIIVEGNEDDGVLGCHMGLPVPGETNQVPWASTPHRDICRHELNYAKEAYDLRQTQLGSVDEEGWRWIPFRIRSMRGNDDVTLQFEVEGVIGVIER